MPLEIRSFKQTRLISDGNFHNCYAKSKAEKFKFRKWSQGLESCAQAQALSFKKKENELLKVLDNFEKEKKRHEDQCNRKLMYRQQLNTQGNENNIEEIDFTDSETDKTLASNYNSSMSFGKDKRASTSFLCNNHSDQSHETVPFYMQHGYTHYHHDDFYDHLIEDQITSHSLEKPVAGVKSWTQPGDKLLKLRHRRNTWGPKDKIIHKPVQENVKTELANSQSSELQCQDPQSFIVSRKDLLRKVPSSNLKPVSKMKLKELPNPVASSILQPQSNLTLTERQELSKHRNCRYIDINLAAKSTSNILINNRRKTFQNIGKLTTLRSALLNKLQNGNLSNEAFDKMLNECDEGSVYPAYKPHTFKSLDDFHTLRKCNYLRMSQLNWESLKETTKQTLLQQFF